MNSHVIPDFPRPSAPERQEISAALLRFLSDELAIDGDDDEQLDEHTPLLAWGIISSLTMASLLAFIRERFAVAVPNDSVTVENFEDVTAIAAMISARMAGLTEDDEHRVALGRGVDSEWIELGPNHRIHALRVHGEREPAWVLLPGLGDPASSWASVLQTLAGEREALAVDLLGFGVSIGDEPLHYLEHAAYVEALLERRFGPRPVVLVASSAGSLIALELARRVPERVAALVLVGFGLVAEPDAWLAELHHLLGEPDEFIARSYYRAPRLDLAQRERIAATTSTPAFRSFLRAEDLEAASFADLTVPTLFVTGSEDRIVGPAAARAAAERIAGARVVELARCGHLPGSEQPEETVDAIEQFLREVGLP